MIGFVLSLAACSVVADEVAKVVQGPSVIVTQADESKFPDITVSFEVRKADRSFILDATRGEFRVTEDGQERPTLGFEAPISTEIKPTTVVLVVDHSGSMRQDNKMDSLKQAVATFLNGLPVGSRVAVIAFSSEIELVCEFTTDRARVQAAVDELEADGGTRYYDSVTAALELLANEPGRRAVLALTDGQDTESKATNLESTIEEARKLGLPVHTLGLGKGEEITAEALALLAIDTRGQHYLASDAASLKKIYEEIAQRLGSSYSLTYRTDRKIADGTLRPIEIYYQKAAQAGKATYFIPGMVVLYGGWSRLFLGLLILLVILTRLPHLKM